MTALPGSPLDANSGTWSVLIGMLVSILFIIVVNFGKIKDKIKDGLKTSAIESLTPLVNSCAVVGFGSVVKVLPIFTVVSAAVLGLSAMPLLSEVISVNLLCAMTASASGGLDNLPYNGATVTVIALCGMTHKQSYIDMFIVATIIPIVDSIVIMILGSMGLCF